MGDGEEKEKIRGNPSSVTGTLAEKVCSLQLFYTLHIGLHYLYSSVKKTFSLR